MRDREVGKRGRCSRHLPALQGAGPLLFVWLIALPALAARPVPNDSTVTAPSLLAQLDQDIADGRLDGFSLIQAAFILSGATEEDSLRYYLSWYDDLLGRLRACHLDPFRRQESASTVFSYLHSFYLREYKEEATTLLDVVRRQKFNCVAGTILYNLVCADLGWPTEAFETPTHVYTIFSDFTQTVTVENTSPMGFNIMRNLRAYSGYLLDYYPQNRAAQIGLDRIYAYENSRGRRINNTELLGLLAYNRAYFAQRENNFATAYEFVLLAQEFNRDSRSNVAFEQDLYFRWGQTLFESGAYDRAFSVFADGAYRYPDVKALAQNCCAAFFQGLRKYRREGNWPESRRLIVEMAELDLLDPARQREQEAILEAWAEYLYSRADGPSLRECLDLLAPEDASRWQALRRAAEELPK
ncbi:MAG TPA: hypothetical protein PKI62_07575 [bacterium]|nr:hypothetical protein [bacterium]HPR86621.1 hypothetical protein [bacterium]